MDKIILIFPCLLLLLLLIAFGILHNRGRNMSAREFRRTIFRRHGFRLAAFLLAAILGASFSVFYWLNASNSASAIITLNYAEASSAQNANGTRYNPTEITCDEVLELAIEKGAFEDVSVSELAECLTVTPRVQGNAYDEDGYHIATEFVLSYTASEKTKHLVAETVVQLIADAYKSFYIDQYADNFDILYLEEDPDFSQMDYLDTVAYLNLQASKVMTYMYGLDDHSSSFIASTGDTFSSVAARVYQLNDVQIEGNLQSYILYNGLSRDVEGYVGRLTYENTLLDYDMQEATASYEVRNEAVSMYAEEMISIVLVPTWDDDAEYYMGRTKVGVDELSVEAEEYSQTAANYLKQIENNNQIIAAMEASAGSGSDDTADALIEEIYENIKTYAALARSIGQEYSETRMNQCITASVRGASLTKCLASGVIAAVAFYLALLLLAVARKLPKPQTDGVYVSEETAPEDTKGQEPRS